MTSLTQVEGFIVGQEVVMKHLIVHLAQKRENVGQQFLVPIQQSLRESQAKGH
jgi:hypothetical protein